MTTLPLLILVSVLPHLLLAESSPDDPPPRQQNRVVCPTDPSVFGYTSILAINDDIQREVEALSFDPLLEPQEQYEYVLCPHTHLNGVDGLEPILNNSVFQCGHGLAENNCTIRGGTHQVLIRERQFYLPLQYVEFRGLSFEASTKYSIAAFAPPSVTARFLDCHWTHNTGESSIHITNHVTTKPPSFVTPEERRKLESEDPLNDEFQASDEGESEYNEYLAGHGHPPLGGAPEEGDGESGPTEPETAPQTEPRPVDPMSELPEGSEPADDEDDVNDNPSGPIKPAMTVELHNCSISGGFGFNATSGKGYRGIFNAGGALVVNETTFERNAGGIFINIMGNESRTNVTNSVFNHNNVTVLLRPTSQAQLDISKTSFIGNRVSASVASKDANLKMDDSVFLENDSLNGEIWSFASEIQLDHLCIHGGSSLQPIFLDEHTEYVLGPIYGANQQVGSNHCATSRSSDGRLGGALVETEGSDCFEGHENCNGHCVEFELGECTLPFFSQPPTSAPKEVVIEAADTSTQGNPDAVDDDQVSGEFGDYLQPPEDEHDAEKPPSQTSDSTDGSDAIKTSAAATILMPTTTSLLSLPLLFLLLGY